MQKKRARERIIMFLCIISLLFTPVLAASQSNAMITLLIIFILLNIIKKFHMKNFLML